MRLDELLLDHGAKECRLRNPPGRAQQGRPSILPAATVRRLRYLYWVGGWSLADCAREAGITPAGMHHILTFKRQAHL